MKTPCDESAIKGPTAANVPCTEKAAPWILMATILASSMAFIDSTVVNVALPALQHSLGATVVDVQWIVESYGLFLGALILVGGALGDLFGRRRVFLAGVGVFALASIGCGVAPNIRELVITRSVQGIGAAFLVPGSLSIISSSFDEKSRGQAIGTWSGFTAITTAIGPVLGGWLIEHASWRWAFLINVPLAAAVIAISLWRIPESRGSTPGRIDWLGALTATIGLGGLVTGFIESANLGWRNPLVLGSLAVGVAALAAFFFIERKERSPMLPLAIFSSSAFRGANLLTLFLYAALGIFFFLFPLDLIQVQGYSATAAGAAALPFILLMFLLSRWSGGLVGRYGPKLPLIIGPLIAASGFALVALPSVGGSYWKTFFPALSVLGFGMAVTVAPLTTVVMSSVGQDRVGVASGINNAVARVAGVLAIAVLGIIMVGAFSSRLHQQLEKGSLPSNALEEIHAHEIKLAGMPIPAGVDPATSASIRTSLSQAFVYGFRLIMFVCAALSIASAAMAWLMIGDNRSSG
jgi:EmrB/QacA subfamily drug resistance transporter